MPGEGLTQCVFAWGEGAVAVCVCAPLCDASLIPLQRVLLPVHAPAAGAGALDTGTGDHRRRGQAVRVVGRGWRVGFLAEFACAWCAGAGAPLKSLSTASTLLTPSMPQATFQCQPIWRRSCWPSRPLALSPRDGRLSPPRNSKGVPGREGMVNGGHVCLLTLVCAAHRPPTPGLARGGVV